MGSRVISRIDLGFYGPTRDYMGSFLFGFTKNNDSSSYGLLGVVITTQSPLYINKTRNLKALGSHIWINAPCHLIEGSLGCLWGPYLCVGASGLGTKV